MWDMYIHVPRTSLTVSCREYRAEEYNIHLPSEVLPGLSGPGRVVEVVGPDKT